MEEFRNLLILYQKSGGSNPEVEAALIRMKLENKENFLRLIGENLKTSDHSSTFCDAFSIVMAFQSIPFDQMKSSTDDVEINIIKNLLITASFFFASEDVSLRTNSAALFSNILLNDQISSNNCGALEYLLNLLQNTQNPIIIHPFSLVISDFCLYYNIETQMILTIISSLTNFFSIQNPQIDCLCLEVIQTLIPFMAEMITTNIDQLINLLFTFCALNNNRKETKANSYECLTELVRYFYPILEPYVLIFTSPNFISNISNEDSEKFVNAYFSFWKAVSKEEKSLSSHFFIIEKSLDILVPIVLKIASMPNSTVCDPDIADVSVGAVQLLYHVLEICPQKVRPYLEDFIIHNQNSSSFGERETALTSLSFLLKISSDNSSFNINSQYNNNFSSNDNNIDLNTNFSIVNNSNFRANDNIIYTNNACIDTINNDINENNENANTSESNEDVNFLNSAYQMIMSGLNDQIPRVRANAIYCTEAFYDKFDFSRETLDLLKIVITKIPFDEFVAEDAASVVGNFFLFPNLPHAFYVESIHSLLKLSSSCDYRLVRAAFESLTQLLSSENFVVLHYFLEVLLNLFSNSTFGEFHLSKFLSLLTELIYRLRGQIDEQFEIIWKFLSIGVSKFPSQVVLPISALCRSVSACVFAPYLHSTMVLIQNALKSEFYEVACEGLKFVFESKIEISAYIEGIVICLMNLITSNEYSPQMKRMIVDALDSLHKCVPQVFVSVLPSFIRCVFNSASLLDDYEDFPTNSTYLRFFTNLLLGEEITIEIKHEVCLAVFHMFEFLIVAPDLEVDMLDYIIDAAFEIGRLNSAMLKEFFETNSCFELTIRQAVRNENVDQEKIGFIINFIQ